MEKSNNNNSHTISVQKNDKIVLIGGLLLMGLTLITGVAVYSVMRQQIESSLGRGLDVALQGKAHLLESQIEKGLADTRALATRPFLIQSIQQLYGQTENQAARGDLESNIHSLIQSGFTAAVVYDAQGNQLVKAGRFSEKHTQALPLGEKNETTLIWDGEFVLHTREAVFDPDGQHIGGIITETTLPQLTRSFSEIRSIGETGTFMLCAPPSVSDQKMACLISQIDGVRFKSLTRVVEGGVLPMDYALDGRSGVIAVIDYRNVPVIEAYAPLEAIGLGMILKLDEAELFKPVTEELKIIMVYLGILIIAEVLLLNGFIRKLIKSEQSAKLAKDKAEQFSFELSLKELELRERLKEITCLYEIRRSIGTELSVEEVCQQIFKHLIPAMQYPESASALIEIDGKRFDSAAGNPTHSNALVSSIKVNGKVCGQLSVFYSGDKEFLEIEEQKLIDTITVDLANWLERKQVDEMLRERLKEITCLYEIRRGISTELSVDKVCRNIFDYLIPAMQFPEIATAVIEIDGRHFESGKYDIRDGKLLFPRASSERVCDDCYQSRDSVGHVLQSDISLGGKKYGYIKVTYPEDKPFLIQEEQKLLDAIASDLESWLDRKRLEQTLVFVAEEQAHTIGQELHDNLGQQIAAIGYQARALEKKIASQGNDSMAAIAASIAAQVQTAVVQIKQLAQGLLPFELEANGVVAALEKLATRIAKTYSIKCDFHCDHTIRINDKNLALNFYRIAQEAANNAIRHGEARHLTISLTAKNDKLILSILDDGCGFSLNTSDPETSGMGIKIMQYRAKQLGAKLKFLSGVEGGTVVRLEMRMV
ncbi:Histidine kinase-, DNA gyrase B-, and HSP90-like ATPase [Nitrosomonas marina]|uniref:histidine kinase n=1 Tax=Nitrosomonas marina TaxID=917 RepID=A0A1I0D4D1_9PROT|nr:ATP-binding protein [Nitrosomonas marina]SET26668.1 Histidine kinase-, DNA gyrase B-, and HSP90-like ATPase [Nitrosomonas marina]